MTGLGALIRRNCKLFFKDKGMFFTSLITPVILLVLYATFLAKVYRDSFAAAMPAGFAVDAALIDGTVGGNPDILHPIEMLHVFCHHNGINSNGCCTDKKVYIIYQGAFSSQFSFLRSIFRQSYTNRYDFHISTKGQHFSYIFRYGITAFRTIQKFGNGHF